MEEILAMTSRSSELCFNKEDFTAENFSVDRFVSEYRKHTSLETLKEDLGLFLKVLQSAMVELINKDYADFVNLSTNLVGLDKSIDNLSTPIEYLKKEVTEVRDTIDETLNGLQTLLKQKEEIHEKKAELSRVMSVLEGIENIEKQNLKPVKESTDVLPCELIERLAVEINRVNFHLSLTSNVPIIQEKQALVEQLSDNLLQHLEAMFLQSLYDDDRENLFKVLRIYSSIDKIKEVESKFRMKVVRPHMREVIDEKVLVKDGIDQMFQLVLDFIPQKCTTILSMTRGGKKETEILKGYDFLVNAVWPEIVICLEYIAPVIFAAGNPTLFHKNYIASMFFLEKFESFCVVQASVIRLRQHSSYESFMSKWNLRVYFEIRFQEIGGFFELALLSAFQRCDDNEPYNLNATSALWKCVKLCWDDNIFIPALCPEFWKLTLQLLSRYNVWTNKAVTDASEDDFFDDPMFVGSDFNKEETRISILKLVLLLRDVELSVHQMQSYFKEVVVLKLLIAKDIFYEAIKQHVEIYSRLPADIGQIVIKRLTAQCLQHLKLITDIPRLYRKTNREIPSKPSSYVTLLFNPLDAFLLHTNSVLSTEWKSKWLQSVIDNVIQQCLNMVADVITSVKKMEDSLKRLKKARDKPVGQIIAGTMSDDDKIRHQLIIDVKNLGEMIKKYNVSKTSINFKKLEDLVHSAVQTSSTTS